MATKAINAADRLAEFFALEPAPALTARPLLTGERMLLLALLESAIRDLRSYPRHHPHYRNAYDWIMRGYDAKLTVDAACAAVGVTVEAVRALIAKQFARPLAVTVGRNAPPARGVGQPTTRYRDVNAVGRLVVRRVYPRRRPAEPASSVA